MDETEGPGRVEWMEIVGVDTAVEDRVDDTDIGVGIEAVGAYSDGVCC